MVDTVVFRDDDMEDEHRGFFQPETEAHVGVIVQGSVDTLDLLKGNESDDVVETYDVFMWVGPYWTDVASVVPKITIDGVFSSNPDQDDFIKWEVRNLKWDAPDGEGPNDNFQRIQLRCQIDVQGEYAQIRRLGYFFLASGRSLGPGSIDDPGPIKGRDPF